MAIDSILSAHDKISVLIKGRKKTYYEGDALALSSTNATGLFDVLPTHANFISMVSDFVKITLPDGTEQEFKLQKGVMRVFENHVDLFLTVSS